MIAILGGGFLGRPLALKLKSLGRLVRISTRDAAKKDVLEQQGLDAWQINVMDKGITGNEAFFDTDILVINVPPGKTGDVISRHPLEIGQVIQCIKKPTKILLISSTSVYPQIPEKMDESTDLQARASIKPSGVALLQVEESLKTFAKEQVTVLRPAGIIGRSRHPGRFLANKKDVRGAFHPVNLVHVDDLIEACVEIIQSQLWDKTYNIVMPSHPIRMEYYTEAAKKLGIVVPSFDLSDESKNKWVDGSRIANETNFEYRYSDPLQME